MDGSGAHARVRLELAGEPGTVPDARAFVRRTLAGWQLDDLSDTVQLLTSELATNAVLHARTSYVLVVERQDDVVRVTVYDDSDARPLPRLRSLESTTGRGLGLVKTLSDDWGTTAAGERPKGVWFEVPADPTRIPEQPEGAMFGEDWLAAVDGL